MITLKVTMLAPLHIGDPAGIRRDPVGQSCIPATTIKGRLRAELGRLAETFEMPICQPPCRESMCHPINGLPCIVCQLLGSPWVEGRLYFEDLIAADSVTMTTRQHGARSRQRGVFIGAATTQAEVLPPRTEFNGRIRHGLRDTWHIALVVAGLQAISSFGGGYGVGWGACQIEITPFDLSGHRLEPSVLADAFHAR